MLTLDQFSQEVASRITGMLDADVEVSLKKIVKNNDITLTGLIIQPRNSNIAPTIYMEGYYDDYKGLYNMDEILTRIVKVANENMADMPFDVESITSLEKCRDWIVPRLINTEMNRNLLDSRPHKEIADLSITYAILLDRHGEVTAAVPVTYQLMEQWGISCDELYELAIENQVNAEKSVIMSMKEVLKGLMSEDTGINNDIEGDTPEIYILSNETKVNGAAAVLDKRFMDDVIDRVGERFYILPSSIHEVLVVPDKGGVEKDMLESMVREVNGSTVSTEEQLSDHVYIYNKKEGLKLAV